MWRKEEKGLSLPCCSSLSHLIYPWEHSFFFFFPEIYHVFFSFFAAVESYKSQQSSKVCLMMNTNDVYGLNRLRRTIRPWKRIRNGFYISMFQLVSIWKTPHLHGRLFFFFCAFFVCAYLALNRTDTRCSVKPTILVLLFSRKLQSSVLAFVPLLCLIILEFSLYLKSFIEPIVAPYVLIFISRRTPTVFCQPFYSWLYFYFMRTLFFFVFLWLNSHRLTRRIFAQLTPCQDLCDWNWNTFFIPLR